MIAAQCKMARAALGLGVRELADRAKVSPDTIARLERGEELKVRTIDAIRTALESAGVEFTNGGQPGVRMKKSLINLQFRNAQLRGKITRALHAADESLQREDDERAKRLAKTADDTVETLTDIFENLRGRAIALVEAGAAKIEDFPEIA